MWKYLNLTSFSPSKQTESWDLIFLRKSFRLKNTIDPEHQQAELSSWLEAWRKLWSYLGLSLIILPTNNQHRTLLTFLWKNITSNNLGTTSGEAYTFILIRIFFPHTTPSNIRKKESARKLFIFEILPVFWVAFQETSYETKPDWISIMLINYKRIWGLVLHIILGLDDKMTLPSLIQIN